MPATRAELKTQIRTAQETAEHIASLARSEHRDLEPIEAEVIRASLREARDAESMLALLPKPEPARPKKPVYYDGGQHSYYADLAARAAVDPFPGIMPHEAEDRLRAHARETESHFRIGAEISERRAHKYGAAFRGATGEAMQFRDLSQTDGLGGEFNPPIYLVDHFANVARACAPAWHLSPGIDLPPGCYELVIPQFTSKTGAVAAPAAQNTVPEYDDTVSASVTSFVTMVVSQTTVSYQALQQGPMTDKVLAESAAEDIAAELEAIFFSGTGNAEPYGVQSTSGVGSVFCTATSTDGIWQSVAAAGREVGNARNRPPTACFMAPQRAVMLTGYQDGSGDTPAQRPGQGVFLGTGQDGGTNPFTTFAGMGVYATGGVPQQQGSGSDLDVIFVGRIQDSLVATSPVTTRIMPETGGAQLSATFQQYLYCAAFPAARYPSAWAYVDGTGLTYP
jgi:HK97 family phage major capsid protein